ncbi:MAG: CDP-alcohol phosphatidyltransferase family protein [Bradymonadia bacterium]
MDTLAQWLQGDLSPTARIWTALAPAILLVGYFFAALAVFAVISRRKGAKRDAEMDARGSSVVLSMFLRQYFAWLVAPLFSVLRRSGLPPNAITTLSVLLAGASGVAIAAGRFALGGWLYIFAGMCDFMDGRLARITQTSSARGAALDSILDRYSDAAILIGLGWYYRETWVLLPVMLTMLASLLTSYVRAKGESMNIEVKVGMMQRAERHAVLGASVALSPILAAVLDPMAESPMHWLAVGGIVFLTLTTNMTALSRLTFLLNALDDRERPGALSLGRGGAFRSIVSSLLATGADLMLVMSLVSSLAFPPAVATAVGCVLGAVINFVINRFWAFDGTHGAPAPQAARYTLVSVTSALLNAGGVAVMLLLPEMDYLVAWLVARATVFFLWNFPLHRDYVFEVPQSVESVASTHREPSPEARRRAA